MSLNGFTLPEAKNRAEYVIEVLAKAGVDRFLVRNSGAESFEMLESIPRVDVARGVYVLVEKTNAVGCDTVYLPNLSDWADPALLLLVCGLIDLTGSRIRKRVKYWDWTGPATWKEERAAYRQDRTCLVNAVEFDCTAVSLAQLTRKHEKLKRKWDAVFASVAPKENAPAKRQKTDVEILDERARRSFDHHASTMIEADGSDSPRFTARIVFDDDVDQQ